MASIFGSSVLFGDNTAPGIPIPKDLQAVIPKIFQAVRDYGCDFYDTIIHMLNGDEISEIASYGGFPVRYPHWRFGMEYEELQTGYEMGLHKIHEMVINTSPSHIYCLNTNTLLDNVLVIAHALGHNDFFKNNIYFSQTNRDMLNKMANNGNRIRKYMDEWGKQRVVAFIDRVLSLETLVDPTKAWEHREYKDYVVSDKREYFYPRRIPNTKDFMEEWVNPKEWRDQENERVKRLEAARLANIFEKPERNILRYLIDHAPLRPWQADVASMLYEEAMYFYPQRQTKTSNEGWASKVDFEILAGKGLAALGQKSHDCGIVEYALHKAAVLGGKYSVNPYKLGFELLQHIEERWNKGQFGSEWEQCEDIHQKENWDLNLGLGKQKIFEVRKYYNDFMLILDFFTEEFCEKNEFFEWKTDEDGNQYIANRDFKKIKKGLLQNYLNGGLPDIRLVDPNHRGKGYFLLEHMWDGRPLHVQYAKAVMSSINHLWNNTVALTSRDEDGDEIVFLTGSDDEDEVLILTRPEYEKIIR